MKLLAQIMTPKLEISGNSNNTAYNDTVIISVCSAEQNPKSFLIVAFLLSHLPVTYIGLVIFSNICRTQHKKIQKPIYLGAFTLSSAHLEFLGLILMAWKTLKRQVLLMDTPLPTL
jgi:hypothetical protein